MKRLNWVLIGVVVLSLFSVVLLGGCVGKSKYEALQAAYEALQADNEDLQAAYQDLLSKEVASYPPGDFREVIELEWWVSEHKQPEPIYLEYSFKDAESVFLKYSFRSALEVQAAGLADGYLISVMYDKDDTGQTGGWVYNAALVDGAFYYWSPVYGEVHSDYASFVRGLFN